jgi:hypothetical protein
MIRKFNKVDSGESLIEVVISAVVLGLIGLLLVSSVATAKPFADKMSLMGQGVAGLNSSAEAINVESFAHCTPTNNQPYTLSVPTNPASSTVSGFAITTTDLPPVLAGNKSTYSVQLGIQNAPGAVNWAVEPPLPTGITLNAISGIISGTTDSPITAQYVFTATSGAAKATQFLTLPSVLIEVLENNGTAWVDCSQIPVSLISAASSDGKTMKYSTKSTSIFNKGNLVSVWNTSDQNFANTSQFVTAANSNSFSVLSSVTGSSTGGFAGLSKEVDVQQVVVSTIVSGTPLKKVIVKSVA